MATTQNPLSICTSILQRKLTMLVRLCWANGNLASEAWSHVASGIILDLGGEMATEYDTNEQRQYDGGGGRCSSSTYQSHQCDPTWPQREQHHINITDSHDKNLNKFNNTMTYSLAKQPPHPNLIIEKLAQKFGTTNFLPALLRFLHQNLPGTTITPTHHDRFDTYKQVVLSLPSNQYTVCRQGQAWLAQGSTQPNSKRARVRPDFVWPGLACIGSRVRSDALARPGLTWGWYNPTLSESMVRV